MHHEASRRVLIAILFAPTTGELKNIQEVVAVMNRSNSSTLSSSNVASRVGDGLRNPFWRRMRSKKSKKTIIRHRDSYELIRGKTDEFVPRHEHPLLIVANEQTWCQ